MIQESGCPMVCISSSYHVYTPALVNATAWRRQGVRHRSDEEPLIKDAAPPSNLQTCLELTATQSQDGMGTPNGPEHSRLLAARGDPCLASSFDDAGAHEQVLSAQFGVTHTLGVVFEISSFNADLLDHFRMGGVDAAERAYRRPRMCARLESGNQEARRASQ